MFPLQNRRNSLVDCARTIFRKIFWLQNSPLLPVTYKLDCFAQFPFQNYVLERSMTLLLRLIPTKFSKGYLIAELYVYFTSFSNAPRFQQSSRNNMRVQICAELLTPWAGFRITDWKMITLSTFHLLSLTPSSSTDRIPKISSWISRNVRHSVG